MGMIRRIDWNRQPLGKVKDQEIADRLGVTYQAVSQARRTRGITSYQDRRRNWIAEVVGGRLGKETDRALAKEALCCTDTILRLRRRLGVSARARPGRGVVLGASVRALLGKLFDTEIAEMAGVTVATVAAARKRQGIPAKKRTGRALALRGSGVHRGVDWNRQPLGKVSDGEVQRRLAARGVKVSRHAVLVARWTRGIPALGREC